MALAGAEKASDATPLAVATMRVRLIAVLLMRALLQPVAQDSATRND
jgi:hypothetical protein